MQNAIRRKNLLVMADKVVSRARDARRAGEGEAIVAWCQRNESSIDEFARDLEANLWQEALTFAEEFAARGKEILGTVPVRLGGPGAFHLLYFLTRLRRPKVVVETGVAAGWSSSAFLQALKVNGDGGQLYSSDFPYFRQNEPEKNIGILVDDNLRSNWHLYVDGDKINLPRILREVERVDMFHYDSDKTYSGREFGLKSLTPKLSSDGVVIFDDIQLNAHFKDRATRVNQRYYVFHYGS